MDPVSSSSKPPEEMGDGAVHAQLPNRGETSQHRARAATVSHAHDSSSAIGVLRQQAAFQRRDSIGSRKIVKGTRSALRSPHDTNSSEDDIDADTEGLMASSRRRRRVTLLTSSLNGAPLSRSSSPGVVRFQQRKATISHGMMRHSISANNTPAQRFTQEDKENNDGNEISSVSDQNSAIRPAPEEAKLENAQVADQSQIRPADMQLPPSIVPPYSSSNVGGSTAPPPGLQYQMPAYQFTEDNPTSASTDAATVYYDNPVGPKDINSQHSYWPPGNPLGNEQMRRMNASQYSYKNMNTSGVNTNCNGMADSDDDESDDDANSVIEEAMNEQPHQWKYSTKKQLLDSAGVWIIRLVQHLFIAGLIMIPGMVCLYNVDGQCKLLNTSLYFFSLWISIVVISHFVGSLAVTLVMLVIKRIPYLGVQFLYYINNIGKPFTWFFVALTTFVSWTTIFWTEPFFSDPRWGNSGYMGSFVTSVLVTGVAFFARALLMRLIAIRFHRTAYYKRIKNSLFAEYVLLHIMVPKAKQKKPAKPTPFNFLGVSRPESLVDMSMENPDGEKTTNNLVLSSEFFKKLLPSAAENEGSLLYTLPVTQNELTDKRPFSNHKLATYVEFIKHNSFSYTQGVFRQVINRHMNPDVQQENTMDIKQQPQIFMTNMQAAKVLSSYIFDNMKQPNQDHIFQVDFENMMNKELGERAFELFDGSWDESLDEKDICTTLLSIFRERNALRTALNDAELAISRLGAAVTGITVCVLIIAYFILFKSDPGQVLMSVSSFLLATAFAIGSSIKNLLESIIFLFVTHPFDIGDRIVLSDKGQKPCVYTVTKLSLLTSELKRFDNAIIYFSNSSLSQKPIINLRRSPDQIDIITLEMNFQTPTRVLREFEVRISEYLARHTHNFHKKFEVEYREVENVNKMVVRVWIQHRSNFHNMRRFRERHGRLIIRLKKICEQLCIDYELPQQRVVYEGLPNVWPHEVGTIDDYAVGTDPLVQAAYGKSPAEMPRLRRQPINSFIQNTQ